VEQSKNGKEFSNNATSKVVSVQTYNELMFAKDKSFDMRLCGQSSLIFINSHQKIPIKST
jgi:hypothetical protein